VVGAADEHAALDPQQLGRLGEHDLHDAGVLALFGAQAQRMLAGRHRPERDRCALHLRDRGMSDGQQL
jgi:hypothetical protein